MKGDSPRALAGQTSCGQFPMATQMVGLIAVSPEAIEEHGPLHTPHSELATSSPEVATTYLLHPELAV